MRQAFTMIELIFVIVIIGVLSAVAIPKLTANRTSAEAAMCEYAVSKFSRELVNYYTLRGHEGFISKSISKITNVKILNSDPNYSNGIVLDGYITDGIQYNCDNVKLATFKYSFDISLDRYILVMQVYEGSTPSSFLAYNTLKRSLNIDTNTGKYYVF